MHRLRWSPLLFSLALTWAGPAHADERSVLEEMRPFLEASNQASEASLDGLGRRFDLGRLPLVAAAINDAERHEGPAPGAYDALSRWHFWLTRRLDDDRSGLWKLPAPGGASTGRSSAGLPRSAS